MNDEVTRVTVADPYIILPYQGKTQKVTLSYDRCLLISVENFLAFCQQLIYDARNVRHITLVTQKRLDQNRQQLSALRQIKNNLARLNVDLKLKFHDFHDRVVKLV